LTTRRFLFLTQTYPRFDGDTSGPFIRDIARGLVRGGDAVTVLTPHAPDVAKAWDDDGVAVRSFRYAPQRLEVIGYSRSLEADEGMKKGALLMAPFYWLGARRALARELRRQRYDLVQAHWVVPNALAAAPEVGRVPLAVGLHGSDVFLAEKPLARQWVGRALRRVGAMTGCSPELVARVCALGFPAERARVIPYGVDGALFAPAESSEERQAWRRKLGIPADAPTILTVGRMATKKGFHVLMARIDALMTRHPTCHVVLAGAGDLLAEMQRAAAGWPGRVHFPGAVYRDTLPDLYRAADLFVLPAVHDPKGNVDGLPNVILEAMATGLPVVATAISGIPLAVFDSVNGRLVPEQNADALLEAVLEVLADPARARAMGASGRRHALSELSWDAVAARYREAYELAIAGAPAKGPRG
jgi:glycosyltransferase involved in cell wall biosynthesis